MYKVLNYLNPPNLTAENLKLQFDLEVNNWQFVSEIKLANLIFIQSCITLEDLNTLLQCMSSDQILVVLDLWHIDNNYTETYIEDNLCRMGLNDKKVIWVHTNYAIKNKKHAYYDFLFNRTKAYFTDYEIINNPATQIWTYNTIKEVYELRPIFKTVNCKRYFAPMRIYYKTLPRMIKRMQLRELLINCDDGYLNNNEENIFFEANNGNKASFVDSVTSAVGGSWFPMDNKYYEDSVASIFVESVTDTDPYGEVTSATEKTFDPLIKGHFILPYSTINYIAFLKEHYGFKFPEWIDYSYDSLPDMQRFPRYLESVKNFLNIDKTNLLKWANQDRKLLDNNRQVFYNRDYDSLYDAIKKSISYNGF